MNPPAKEVWNLVRSLGWEDPWRRARQSTPDSGLKNPVDRAAWWATVHRVHRVEHNWRGLAWKHILVHTQMYICNIYMQFPDTIIRKLTFIILHYFKNYTQFALRTFFIYFCSIILIIFGFPRWLGGKVSACQCKRHNVNRFKPWVEKIPRRRKWEPTPIFSSLSRALYTFLLVAENRWKNVSRLWQFCPDPFP